MTYITKSNPNNLQKQSPGGVFVIKNGVIKNFAKLAQKQLCRSFEGLRPATSSKMGLRCRCFLVAFAKFLKTAFLQNTSGRLLLNLAENKHTARKKKAMRKSHCINKWFSRSSMIILYFQLLSIFFPGYMHLLRSLPEEKRE